MVIMMTLWPSLQSACMAFWVWSKPRRHARTSQEGSSLPNYFPPLTNGHNFGVIQPCRRAESEKWHSFSSRTSYCHLYGFRSSFPRPLAISSGRSGTFLSLSLLRSLAHSLPAWWGDHYLIAHTHFTRTRWLSRARAVYAVQQPPGPNSLWWCVMVAKFSPSLCLP